jgi:hypothetical protein
VWRNGNRTLLPDSYHFIDVFQSHWNLLPRPEAISVLHEIVEQARCEPEDGYVSMTYNVEETVTINSASQYMLFEVWHVLRELDPELAESLIGEYGQLATAARRFPNGRKTLEEEAEARARDAGQCAGGFVFLGSPEDFPYSQSLVDADSNGDFGPPFEHALATYAGEISSNYAPKEFWRSAWEFRDVLCRAARRNGPAAGELLDRIPDADLRLLAAIEVEAVLARLPELFATTMTQTEEQREHSARGPVIRCPKCGWRPGPEDRWQCKCGFVWNTFETGGVCPGCFYQWMETACLRCGEWSAHSDWYGEE